MTRTFFYLLHHLTASFLVFFGWAWTKKFYDWTYLWGHPVEIVCLVYVEKGKVLGVARRGTTDQWGLPGGKVEPGEDPFEAIGRETFEETKVKPVGVQPFFRDFSQHEHKVVQVYRAAALSGLPVQGDAGSVDLISWDQLKAGPFGKFHENTYNRYFLETFEE